MPTQTQSQLRQNFETDGFLIHPEPVISHELLQRAVAGMDAVRRGEFDTGESHAGVYGGDPLNPRVLCKIEQAQLANKALREAVASPKLHQLALEITGAKWVQVWWVQMLVKPPSKPGEQIVTNVGWHQDMQYWKDWSKESNLFTAWLALSDVTLSQGPLIFARGSQEWGLLDQGDFFGQDLNAAGIRVPQGKKWEEVPAILQPGGVSFHHRFTFHGSGPNTSGTDRRSLAIHMRTDQSSIPADAEFAKYIERLEVCPRIYR